VGNKQFVGFVAETLSPHIPHGQTASSLAEQAASACLPSTSPFNQPISFIYIL